MRGMMIVLPDDRVLETFDSPDQPPDWIEWVDVEAGRHRFCDNRGQLYAGRLVQAGGFLQREQWELYATGEPDIENALALVDGAAAIEPLRCHFSELATLRDYLLKRA
jgi:hypothetical protein